ncbi:uncharacterized protein MYCFIDRAFT_153196 [Pseudocercospora fijiensis CIRAD86]|uniref:SGNH hydrolase-type esterase domain-containing protein n=1 Tax=Pseudocercospora fijiensis (strain CIRAD86) TaxID=383855 RepID=M3A1S9_PSEFD|nr:uncharacterized protein MYCFIDRAFT_153196 [Pseudocercospora fijiensis CIRAD86]EME85124.1 hypothetical protein MYCFIDRAFT_153196 [Pseudocercospora fijiensis CIRAD86]
MKRPVERTQAAMSSQNDSPATATSTSSNNMLGGAIGQFLLFGDSITQQSFNQDRGFGFGAQLSDAYVRQLDVVNRGFSGYNTRQALEVLPHALPSRQCAQVRFMTFFFGANDSRLPDTPGGPQQHVPLDEFASNTKALVNHPDVRGHEGIRRILITPPPVDERKCLESDKSNDPNYPDVIRRRASVTKQYAEAVKKVGEETQVHVIDFWSALISRAGGSLVDPEPTGSINMPKNDVLQSFLHDGLHLSPAGYKVLYEELLQLINRTWPEESPDQLAFVFPRWDDTKAWQPNGKRDLTARW